MNRWLLSLFAGLSLAAVPHRAPLRSAQSAAPRTAVAPTPRPSSPIPGLRLSWSIDPASVRFDAQYAPSALASGAPVGRNGFPAANVPVRIVLRMHNDTATPIAVNDGSDTGWQLTMRGPGAVSVENRSACRLQEIARMGRNVSVPAHGDAEITLSGLATGNDCPSSAWFYTARGHYTVEGTLRTHYSVNPAPGGGFDRGTSVLLTLPTLAFDVN